MSVMDFRDDLASLHSESPEHSYRHNIFDVSAPTASSPHSQLNFNDFSSSAHSEHGMHHSGIHHHAYLNSTLPTINSSMRYDPLPPPDTFGFSSSANNNGVHGLQRHTPSPIETHGSRQSRSRSRPPTSGGPSGVVRTTRTRRTGSLSSTSPPPPNGTSQWGIDFAMQRPGAQAIVIPRSHSQSGSHHANGGGGTPVSPVSAGWDYGLPPPPDMSGGGGHSLPQSLHHHSHHGSFSNGYSAGAGGFGGLGISPGANELLGTPGSLTSSTLSGSPPNSNGPDTPPSTTASVPGTGKDGQPEKVILASEKRRRRRESHNAVERRRRDNINERISELATLIPISMLAAEGDKVPNGGTNGLISIPVTAENSQDIESIAGLTPPETADGGSPSAIPEGGVVKANKGMILRKSVEYIRYLQQIVTAQGARNRELEDTVRAYREGPNGSHHGTKTPTPGTIGSFSPYGVSGTISGINMGMFGASLEDLPEHLTEDDEDEDETRRGRSVFKRGTGPQQQGKTSSVPVDLTSEEDDEEMQLIEDSASIKNDKHAGAEPEVKMEVS